jgi:methylenetetrahydrofolate dehydrogenase (NADP+)/methenyltetrahydrofolate cyclohydrolase
MNGANIIDGKKIASIIREQIVRRVSVAIEKNGRPPGLAVVMVGDNPASQSYVRSKEQVASRCGFFTRQINLPGATTCLELDAVIDQLNKDNCIDGILLQLPLPPHLDSHYHINRIAVNKDADGLTVINQGLLASNYMGVRPCTPLGVMRLLDEVMIAGRNNEDDIAPRVSLAGKKACIIGRSNLVGKPLASLMLAADATVTIAHSRTTNLPATVKEADIVVAACGRARLVKGDWIKRGAIVIDVGINRLDDGSLVGDVDFREVAQVAAAVTPVPGGVGPMTVAMLMYNTYLLYELACTNRV